MAVEAEQTPAERTAAPHRVLVVIPTYNEVDNIADILDRVRLSVPTADLLVVDDGSPDGTADRVRWVAQRLDGTYLLERATKNGLGGAYRAGFEWGLGQGYEILVEMDADGSHRPEDLPKLLAAIDDGADLVVGSRYIEGGEIPNWKWSRRLLSKGGNQYASLMLGLGVHDATGGYRAYRASLLRRIDFANLGADGYGFQIEGTLRSVRAGARVIEVPIRFEDRVAGESKMSKAIVFEALRLVTRWGVSERVERVASRVAHPFHRPNWAHAGLAGGKRSN